MFVLLDPNDCLESLHHPYSLNPKPVNVVSGSCQSMGCASCSLDILMIGYIYAVRTGLSLVPEHAQRWAGQASEKAHR